MRNIPVVDYGKIGIRWNDFTIYYLASMQHNKNVNTEENTNKESNVAGCTNK
jgi:hypothetical protein